MLSSTMKASLATLVLIVLVLPSCDGHKRGHLSHERIRKPRRPSFKSSPWKAARATFYEGSSTSFGTVVVTLYVLQKCCL